LCPVHSAALLTHCEVLIESDDDDDERRDMLGPLVVRLVLQQHHQALLKAKYCPRVAAALCTQKTPRNSGDLKL